MKTRTIADDLIAQIERMRPVVDAAVRVAELDEICEAHPGNDDEAGHRAEAQLLGAVAARHSAVEAYRVVADAGRPPRPKVPPTAAEIRAVVERSRDVVDRSIGEMTLVAIVSGVEHLLDALAHAARSPQASADVTAAIAALGQMGVRLPQRVIDRLERRSPDAS